MKFFLLIFCFTCFACGSSPKEKKFKAIKKAAGSIEVTDIIMGQRVLGAIALNINTAKEKTGIYTEEIVGPFGGYKYDEYGPPLILIDTTVNKYKFWIEGWFDDPNDDPTILIDPNFNFNDTLFKDVPFVSLKCIRTIKNSDGDQYPRGKTLYVKTGKDSLVENYIGFAGEYLFTFKHKKAYFTRKLELGVGYIFSIHLAGLLDSTVEEYKADVNGIWLTMPR